jgi:hypothetical protein
MDGNQERFVAETGTGGTPSNVPGLLMFPASGSQKEPQIRSYLQGHPLTGAGAFSIYVNVINIHISFPVT